MSFVRNLGIGQKLLLIAAAFGLPALVTGVMLARTEVRAYSDAQLALHGVEMFQGIEELLVQIADHGGTLGAILSGDSALKEKLAAINKDAETHAKEFGELTEKYGDAFGTKAEAEEILADWRATQAASDRMTRAESDVAHGKLLDRLLLLNDKVAYAAGISNDPDVAIAHFGEGARLVPGLERSIAALRSVAVGAAESKTISRGDQLLLERHIYEDDRMFGAIERHLEAGVAKSADGAALKTLYEPTIAAFTTLLAGMHDLVRSRIGSADKIDIAPQQLFDTASAAYDKLGDVHDALIPTLTKVLEGRIARARFLMIAIIGGTSALALLGLALAIWLAKGITGSLRQAIHVFGRIEDGDYATVISARSGDEVGQVLGSLAKMQSGLKERLERDAAAAAENARVRVSLDKVSTSVMIADVDGKIIYLNDSVFALFRNRAAEIRSQIPAFDPDRLLGSSFDAFHRSPAHQRNMLGKLIGSATADFSLGSARLRVIASPVLDGAGVRLGTVVQWIDRTEEVRVEDEVKGVVERALAGDLTSRIATTGLTGFFAVLAEGVNSLMVNTADLVRRVDVAAAEVARGAAEISRGNSDLSQRTEEQAASLEETASSMEEMTSTVRQNAENAAQANELAGAARAQAEKGGAVVSSAVAAMEEINASSRRIADIISVIDEIAFQTNLLALNAAVEAARAGEQGRGFAVVASEVRGLASRSADAAKEIKALINDSVGKVSDGSHLVAQSGETLNGIVAAVKKVTDIVAEIAAASAEQNSGIQQVNVAITKMDEVTQQNAGLVEESAAAAEILRDQAAELQSLLANYRVDDGASERRSDPRRSNAAPAGRRSAA
jgi:methyl-accepting chemotaxis protein